MGERAKVILNEYSAKNLLMRDTLDLDKFYTADLKLFVEVARKEIERLNNIIKELEKWLVEWREMLDCPDFYEEGIIDCINDTLIKLQELKGSDKE